MKKIIVFLVWILSLQACDSWIDLEPETSVTFTNYFKSEQDAESVVMEIFARGRNAFANVGFHNYMGLLADEIQVVDFFAPIRQVRNLDPAAISANAGMKCSWAWCYFVIYNCNLLLDNAYRFEDITKERLDFWLAQAYFYKAAAYFKVACDWGDAPIPQKSTDTQPIGRRPVNEVLQTAIDNALKALEMLPLYDELKDAAGAKVASKQWGSKGTAAALLAYIYAWRGALNQEEADWKEAEKYASLVIDKKVGNYELENNPEELCNGSLVGYGKETVWEMDINYTDDIPSTEPYHEAVYYIGYPCNPAMGLGDRFAVKPFGGGIFLNADRVKKMYPKIVENGKIIMNDLRRDAYFYKLDSLSHDTLLPITRGHAYQNKWRKAYVTQSASSPAPVFRNLNQNRIIYRLADLILLRAECRARLGSDGAVDDLNQIRLRAGAPLYPALNDTEGLQMAIFREREKELLLEGHRYYDIVRNGYWKTELPPVFATLSDQDIKNGALYLPVAEEAFDGYNDLMRQTPFWNNRK